MTAPLPYAHDSAAAHPEIDTFLAAHPACRHVDCVLFDLQGNALGKRYPIRDLAKVWKSGVQFCAATTLMDVGGTCWDVFGKGFSDGDPDATALPVPGTLKPVPWGKVPAAQMMIAMVEPETGRPTWYDPRGILARVVSRYAAAGLKPVVACELEFYLLKPGRTADGLIEPPDNPSTGKADVMPRVLSFAKLDDVTPVLDAIDAAARAQGLPASTQSSEYGPGQYEVNLVHVDDPVLAADHACLLRRLIKGVAHDHGFEASFMSKPFTGSAGSGLHVHASVVDRDGRNLFDETRPDGEARLGHAVAGLQASLYDAMAILAPNFNAYRRFAANQFVPVNTSWGFNNRSVAFRLPVASGQARRIEHRAAGAEANPYLVMAVVLAGMLHGLEHRLDPGPMEAGNAGETLDPEFPAKFWTALDRLEKSTLLADWLGADYPTAYAQVKRAELESFFSEITPREYDFYL